MLENSKGALVKIYYPPKDFDGEFFEAIWAARLIESRFQSLMKVINGILPIIYTILGAVAFGVRDLRARSATATWTAAAEVGANLRLLLAVFVAPLSGSSPISPGVLRCRRLPSAFSPDTGSNSSLSFGQPIKDIWVSVEHRSPVRGVTGNCKRSADRGHTRWRPEHGDALRWTN